MKPAGSSTRFNRPAIVWHCNDCLHHGEGHCTREWIFHLSGEPDQKMLVVETFGVCGGPKNVKRAKRENAKKFAKFGTFGAVAELMNTANIPAEERPTEQQINNHRRNPQRTKYTEECVGVLQDFVEHPPEGVVIITDAHVVSKDRVLIPFMVPAAANLAATLELPSFLEDFTLNTNEQGLLLGGVGPVGLHQENGSNGGGLPSMRFLPVFFLLADSEDTEAIQLLMKLYLDWASKRGIEVTDGFFDCKILHAAMGLEEREFYPHRCLQHVRNDVKAESRKRDEVTGKPRLNNTELLEPTIEYMDFTAWLPSDLEFHTFWWNYLKRAEASSAPTDFNEPRFANYLKTHIFDVSGPLIKALWSTGLGAVPLGMTTFAPNSIEVTHRVIKGLLPKGYKHSTVKGLVSEVTKIVTNRVRQGKYDKLVSKLSNPPAVLFNWPRAKFTAADPLSQLTGQGEGRSKRVDFNDILQHYRKHGPAGTFLTQPILKVLSTGEVASRVYVFPKYRLEYAHDRQADMQSMLALASARTQEEVERACASRSTGNYDFHRHMYLRRTFVSVFYTSSGKVADEHKHFVEAAGYSEHSVFITALRKPGYLDEYKKGPQNSRSDKPKHPKKSKMSEKTKFMLSAPGDGSSGIAVLPAHRVNTPSTATQFPGAACGVTSFLAHCALGQDEKSSRCLACTVSGAQCTKKRVEGNFCKAHAKFAHKMQADVLEYLKPFL